MENQIDLGGRGIFHPKDQEYFYQYPAPLMELLHSAHFTNINSTITFYGPMLYFFARATGAEQVLEIGHAEGYTAFYLAHAVKDNGVRFGMKGNRYHGIDIAQTEKTEASLLRQNLPVIIKELDSMKLTPETFGKQFDIIFQDGNHDKEHVVHEFKTMWPALKPGGYWIAHDAAGPAEEGWHEIMKLLEDVVSDPEDFVKYKYSCEHIRFLSIYGLGILRKTEGEDPEKRYWKD